MVSIFMYTYIYIHTYVHTYRCTYRYTNTHTQTIRILYILEAIQREYHLMCLMAQTVVTYA